MKEPRPTAWGALIEGWVGRERRLKPEAPPVAESVEVRDAIEIGDSAFVLISYDVDVPWPREEDAPGADRGGLTAVLECERVRQPWAERDAASTQAQYVTDGGGVVIHEHVLGGRRAFSGHVAEGAQRAELSFTDGTSEAASVIEGWFLVVVAEELQLTGVSVDGGDVASLVRIDDLDDLLGRPEASTGGRRGMYMSPLDLRAVHALVQWQREEDVVVVATCIEQYEYNAILRLRFDGIRADDDVLSRWPTVRIEDSAGVLQSAVSGAYVDGDTASVDVGFELRPEGDLDQLVVHVEGLRGRSGPVAPVVLDVVVRRARS